MPCRHAYRARAAPCPHAPGRLGAAERCIWHNPRVAKHEPWLRELLVQADALAGGDLEEFHLAGLDWAGAELAGRNLRGADLRDARLPGAALGGAILSAANLRRCDLRRAALAGADLSHADLSGCNLAGAVLTGADLRGAILDATVLLDADLSGCNLAGVRIRSFVWNRRTRLTGISGFEPHAAGSDDTQPFLAPIATQDGAAPAPASALADPDPELDRSHVYAPLDDPSTVLHVRAHHETETLNPGPLASPAAPAPAPASHHRWAYAAGLGGLFAGAVLAAAAWWLRPAPPAASGDAGAATARIAALEAQRNADLAELGGLAERAQRLTAELSEARRGLALAKAERDEVRRLAETAQVDAERLHAAADRAAVAEARLAEAERRLADLARSSARGDRLGRILADGAGQLLADNQALERVAQEKVVALRTHQDLVDEAARLRQELTAVQGERDRLARTAESQAIDLRTAQDAIGRYLAKLAASDLGEQLGDDPGRGPLLPVVAGSPITLGGDYLVTVRLDTAAEAGRQQVRVGLTVQRPAGAANPDVAVILYDEAQRPLRRLAFGFPHIDGGPPLVSGRGDVACDRAPRYVRVVVAPVAGPLLSRR